MSDTKHDDSLTAELDNELGKRLRSMEKTRTSDPALDGLFEGVSAQCTADNKRFSGFMQSRPTSMRRLFAVVAFFIIAGLSTMIAPMVAAETMNATWMITSLAYAILLLITFFMAIRPLYIPALSTRSTWGLSVLAVGATLVAAIMPSLGSGSLTVNMANSLSHAPACMGMGLLVGLPVYGIVRALDRDNPVGGLLAAAAAALGGNLILQMHCPHGDAGHILMGHSSVAVLFVAGLGLLHWFFSRR